MIEPSDKVGRISERSSPTVFFRRILLGQTFTQVRESSLPSRRSNQNLEPYCELEFWDIGHKLFRSTPESFPVHFVAGDVLDPSFVAPRDPVYEADKSPNVDVAEISIPDLTSLTPLLGRVSFIHTASLFHLFSEEDQLVVARRFASLLSPAPGSMIFGWHAGRAAKGFRSEAKPAGPGMLGNNMFCHSPESWKEMWAQEVFRPGTVTVEAKLIEKVRDVELVVQSNATPQYLVWSVTRL